MSKVDSNQHRDLCISCARDIYGVNPPSKAYATRVAQLLYGTSAAESDLRYRRQHGFGWDRITGAWGLWQTEHLAVEDSWDYAERKDALYTRCGQWLFDHDAGTLDCLGAVQGIDLMQLISGWDRLAVLMARLHYMRFPESVPATLYEQARYWKGYYNTAAGAGTVEHYLAAWERHTAGMEDW